MTDVAPDIPDGWEGILEPREAILWQGRPGGQVSLRGLEPKRVIFGLIFFSFAVVWTLGAAATSAPGVIGLLFPLFGLPFLFAGARLAGGERLWAAFVRRRSWYTLTDRRAFIASDVFGWRRLEDWPITAASVIDFEEGPPDSVLFADGRGAFADRRIGFEQISDGREVLGLMRRIQRGNA